MYKKLLIIALVATFFAITGCGNKMWDDTKKTTSKTYDYVFDRAPTARSYHDEASIPIIKVNYQAADVLAQNVTGNELTANSPIYMKIFKNAQDSTDDSVFGLVITQQVGDRLVQRDIHLKKGDPKPEEYLLPQNMDMKKYDSPVEYTTGDLPPRAAMLDGHYVIGDQYVYVTALITRLDDNVIISGHNWTVPLSDNVRLLLNKPMPEKGMEPTVKNQFEDK